MPASNPWISLFKAPIWVSSLLIFGVDLTSSAVIQAANQPANLNLPSLTLPLNGTDERWHCSRSQDWLTSTFDGNDCFEVIEKFANIEEKAHGQSKYEFLAPFAHTDHHSLKPQATPRRYKSGKPNSWKSPMLNIWAFLPWLIGRSGTCVMQIVMLSDPVLGNVRVRKSFIRRQSH